MAPVLGKGCCASKEELQSGGFLFLDLETLPLPHAIPEDNQVSIYPTEIDVTSWASCLSPWVSVSCLYNGRQWRELDQMTCEIPASSKPAVHINYRIGDLGES